MSAAPTTPSGPSTLALKIIVAVTGIVLVGFVVQHMVAHLQMFLGREAYNSYAEMMQGLGAFKWAARSVILAAFVAHIWGTITLIRRNRGARPQAYDQYRARRTTLSALMMGPAGLCLLAFVVFHLGHFTLFQVATTFDGIDYAAAVDEAGRHDVYGHFVRSFETPWLLAVYLVACVALAMHLRHGVQSLGKTLGLAQARFRPLVEIAGPVVAIVTFVGFVSVPLACFLGMLEP